MQAGRKIAVILFGALGDRLEVDRTSTRHNGVNVLDGPAPVGASVATHLIGSLGATQQAVRVEVVDKPFGGGQPADHALLRPIVEKR